MIDGVLYDVKLDMNGRGTVSVDSVGGAELTIEVQDVVNGNFEVFTPVTKTLYQDSLLAGSNVDESITASGGNDVLIGDASSIVQTADSYQTIATFDNGGHSSGINSKNGWSRSGNGNGGGSVSVVDNDNYYIFNGTDNDYLKLVDSRETGKGDPAQRASIFKSDLIQVSENGTIKFEYETSGYKSNDSLLWYLVDSTGAMVGTQRSLSSVSDFTSKESDPLDAGSYRLVFEVLDNSSSGSLELRIDNIQIGTHTTTADPVGNDTLLGGDGNDILFGDALNTDNLLWMEGRPDTLPDGSGLDALKAYLKADSWVMNRPIRKYLTTSRAIPTSLMSQATPVAGTTPSMAARATTSSMARAATTP